MEPYKLPQNIVNDMNELNLNNKQQKILISSAFPETKKVEQLSIFHEIIKKSEEVGNNITYRNFRHTDVIQVRHLNLQWFPLVYGDYFYNRLLANEYKCLVAQTEVKIQWQVLKTMLKQKYEKQKAQQDKIIHSGQKRNPILLNPSSYFVQQGIKFEYLIKQYNSNLHLNLMRDQGKTANQIAQQQQNAKFNTINMFSELIGQGQQQTGNKVVNQADFQNNFEMVIKLKIIVGVMVFDITPSKGYLSGSWWQQTLFGINNAVYINTIGVIAQFRKHGVAAKMLEWLISKTQKETSFKFIHLHVIEYNVAAIRLYNKLGFNQIDIQQNYYNIDNKQYSAKLLGLFVNGGQKKLGWKQWFNSFWG